MQSVLQEWVMNCTVMQQGVLLGGMRGADGVPKYNSTKYLLRWYRRCTLVMAIPFAGVATDPVSPGGGSYCGPSVQRELVAYTGNWELLMEPIVDDFIKNLDGLPHHFVQHLRHGIQIIGYKHPDARIRDWWHTLYIRLVNDEHLHPETEAEMDKRLGDNYEDWFARADKATAA